MWLFWERVFADIIKLRILRWDHPELSAAAKSLQSCPALCDPIDSSPPGFPVPGILQARTLEWVAISFSNAWKWKVKVKSLSRVWPSATPWCSLPGSSVHGIFQARVLEWGAIAFSTELSEWILNPMTSVLMKERREHTDPEKARQI